MGSESRRLGYLSGAPRVSTRSGAALTGLRAHVLGVIGGFRQLDWEVRSFIIGDRVPLAWVAGQGSETGLRSSLLKRIAADGVRLQMGLINGWRARRELGAVDWVYERLGAMQALGWWFQQQGVPWIVETNALLFREASAGRKAVGFPILARMMEYWIYRRCDAVVCISRALADLLIDEAGVDPQKVIVVPNGVDVAHLSPDGQTPHRPFEGPAIGFVGYLQQWQRLDLLLEALAALRAEGIAFSLVVVGDGPMRTTWESLAGRLGLANRVRFVGQVPWSEIPAYIAGFDLGYAGAVPLAAGAMYLSPLKLYEYAAVFYLPSPGKFRP